MLSDVKWDLFTIEIDIYCNSKLQWDMSKGDEIKGNIVHLIYSLIPKFMAGSVTFQQIYPCERIENCINMSIGAS